MDAYCNIHIEYGWHSVCFSDRDFLFVLLLNPALSFLHDIAVFLYKNTHTVFHISCKLFDCVLNHNSSLDPQVRAQPFQPLTLWISFQPARLSISGTQAP